MLHVQNLIYQYDTQPVLESLSLDLDRGELGLLVGHNGAGKSTLLRCLAGWAEPSAGTITVNALNVQESERAYRRAVLFVPDTPDFYDELTAWEHMQLVAQLNRISAWQAAGENLLHGFGLTPHRDALPFKFSRGMRYKLALCLALLIRPPLLLLDEPFGPLDAPTVRHLWQLLRAFTQDGHTVLLSSHTLPDGMRPDVIFHLHDGTAARIAPGVFPDLADLLNHVE